MNKNEADIKQTQEPIQSEVPLLTPENEKNSHSNSMQHSNSNVANDYTGTTIGKVCSKSSKNVLLVITIIIILMIYYFYINFNVVAVLSRSKVGLNYRFWEEKSLNDYEYMKGLIYFTFFHIFFFIFLICFYKVIFTAPGYFSQEYIEIFSLKNKLNGTNLQGHQSILHDEDFFEVDFDISDVEKMFDNDSECNDSLQKLESKLNLIFKF